MNNIIYYQWIRRERLLKSWIETPVEIQKKIMSVGSVLEYEMVPISLQGSKERVNGDGLGEWWIEMNWGS